MNKIRIVGALIFVLSIILAVLFMYTAKESLLHESYINTINEHKDFTQDISKNIFYIYKNKNSSTDALNNSVNNFAEHMSNKEKTLKISKEIINLWNYFYLNVQHFRNQIKDNSLYSDILLQKSIKDIYNTNLKLIVEFDKLLKTEHVNFQKKQNIFIVIQYTLFSALVLLLIYLFGQLSSVITFIQKFLITSKSIIKNSTIKELRPIKIDNSSSDISHASYNFNALVKKINDSIEQSTNSIEHSFRSLEIVEQHTEELVELIDRMNEDSRDKNLRQKEDAIIQSLEELSSTARKLKNLKDDLDSLISHSK